MFRSVASSVSALSSSVANGHQTLHLVSSAPSKIPYGGFSPVRLQTRFEPRPPSRKLQAPPIGRHRSYLRVRRSFRKGTCVQAAPDASDQNHGSSGPWLPRRLCCPAGSSLTMATSAPLSATRRLRHSSARLAGSTRQPQRVPNLLCPSFLPCRRPYSGGPRDCFRRCLHREFRLRHFRIGSATTSPTCPDRVGRLTKLQRSRNATAWKDCLPRSGQGFYGRACLGRVTPDTQVGYHGMAHRHLPSPDLHRRDGQPGGLFVVDPCRFHP
jgi:hypothetical protein